MKVKVFFPYVFIVFVFVFMFFGFLPGRKVLLGTDAVISNANRSFHDVLILCVSAWKSVPLLGTEASRGVNFVRILMAVFRNGILWNNWYHGLGCLLASFFLIRYLFTQKVSAWATIVASLAAFWVGGNLTIIYGGHPAKPYIVMLFVAALLPVSRAVSGSIAYSLLWGGCVGLMFVHQPDVATFFALFSGAYLLFRLLCEHGLRAPLKWLRVLVPALLLALLFATGPLLDGYRTHVKQAVQSEVQTPEQKWDYITQWSLPPDEAGGLVAPGYFGLRSGEPEGPYWGRIGQTPGWEKTHQGMRNFKLDDGYIGLIPVALALFALFGVFRSEHRREIWFWSGAAVVSLLLAMGRYSILYKLFYQLPVVNNIRAPVKFEQVFQVCVAILAAYGVHSLLSIERDQKTVRRYLWVMVGVSGLMLILLFGALTGLGVAAAEFRNAGWPAGDVHTMASNKVAALGVVSVMALIMTAVFAVMSFVQPERANQMRGWIGAILALSIAVDAVRFSKHYMKEMPKSFVEANSLTDFLKRNIRYERVALAQEQQIFGVLKSYTLPYNGIPVFNPGDMSRMPTDYWQFLQSAQRDPLSLWEFSSVRFLLAPAGMASQVPPDRVRKVFSCSLSSDGRGGFKLAPDASGGVAVFELLRALPRYALFSGSRKMNDETALQRISDLAQLSLSEDSVFPELPGTGICGAVSVEEYRPDRVVLSVHADSDAILRCADRYADGWRASVDGRETPVEPVDYICQGVFIPAGSHQVVMNYVAPIGFLWAQMSGYAVFIAALMSSVLARIKERE